MKIRLKTGIETFGTKGEKVILPAGEVVIVNAEVGKKMLERSVGELYKSRRATKRLSKEGANDGDPDGDPDSDVPDDDSDGEGDDKDDDNSDTTGD